ncbi:MAG TPA: hypothetical protein VMH83_03735, partial [Candidatus Acidoferrum sp.]|nr:hypothetical protein [Candidatus Acidoferrum sp.]
PLMLALTLTCQAAEPARSLADCQAITDRTARFDCYDKFESRPQATIPSGATQSTIPAKLPTPSSSSEQTAASTTAASSAKVNTLPTEPSKKPFYKRLLPFGWGDDKKDDVTTSAAATTPANKAPAAAPDSTVDNFGISQKSAKVGTTASGLQELTDTVADVKLSGANTRTITLTSGQVWRQMYDQTYMLEIGDKVSIRPSTWGDAYRLYSDRLGSFIQVKRIDQPASSQSN